MEDNGGAFSCCCLTFATKARAFDGASTSRSSAKGGASCSSSHDSDTASGLLVESIHFKVMVQLSVHRTTVLPKAVRTRLSSACGSSACQRLGREKWQTGMTRSMPLQAAAYLLALLRSFQSVSFPSAIPCVSIQRHASAYERRWVSHLREGCICF